MHAVGTSIEQRVARAAEAALQDHDYVAAVDVLIGMGWLQPVHRDQWRQGRVPYLERVVQAGLGKTSTAMRALPRWAREQGLQPSETAYLARTRDRRTLRFSASGDPSIERAYRTHWVSTALSEAKRTRVTEQASRPPDLVVVSPLKDWTCATCGGTGELLLMADDAPLCLVCAGLDHLAYLPAGDATLTRRARKASRLSAVVVRFSRSRQRYEGQGILVDEQALAEAESSCLADAEARARRRARDEQRRREADSELAEQLAEEIRRLFPRCPPERAAAIAAHTAARCSGRIGRTAAGQRLDEQAVELAVVAAVRHHDTDYDALLMAGVPRNEARERIHGDLAAALDRWRRH
ncbi:DUF2293 domain-containing protein [Blastococcus saxobsidens]|uniref:DUF2293 domain-containing protein n=1 Tax=Blastococcus saxobsidens (strain DD2) TaxID=1146883 RepID=H6RJV5_BLASD|nr:DUF2293 domain-containing protein [Blastococcus saxobsidens]CCG03608.1 conserved protein of unknown function [Blastococcus saxobsidens DD2]